ncbi:hypothetical protein GCM10009740_37320 [Terrabacter terrae]|uniref:Uncharacterized protein n=1 Tax=Terrabacter terrae TaxID=318434 RepID=A0ABP5G7I7_9MICO
MSSPDTHACSDRGPLGESPKFMIRALTTVIPNRPAYNPPSASAAALLTP